MPSEKYFTKAQILEALDATASLKAAARFLGVSYIHFRKWAKLYKDPETGRTLFDTHKNRAGKGVYKGGKGVQFNILDVIEGRIDTAYFTPHQIKQRMIDENLIEEKCNRCGFNEKRVIDNKCPLLFVFSDGNKKNYNLKNLTLLCYNCYFLYIGNIFSNSKIDSMEDYHSNTTVKEPEWELDEYQLTRLKELGLHKDNENDIDINKYISNI